MPNFSVEQANAKADFKARLGVVEKEVKALVGIYGIGLVSRAFALSVLGTAQNEKSNRLQAGFFIPVMADLTKIVDGLDKYEQLRKQGGCDCPKCQEEKRGLN